MDFIKKIFAKQNFTLLTLSLALIFSVLYRGGISLQGHLIFAFLIGLCAFRYALYRIKTKDKEHQPDINNIIKSGLAGRIKFIDIFLILYFIFFLFSFFFSETKNYGILELIEVFGGILIFWITSRESFEKKYIEKFLEITVLIATLSSLIGIFAYLTKPFDRFAGSFQNFDEILSAFPNAHADFILLILPFIILKLWGKNYCLHNIIWSLTFIINGIGFYLTDSIGARISIFGMMALWIFYKIFIKDWNDLIKRLSSLIYIGAFIAIFAISFETYHHTKFPESNLENFNNQQIANLEQNTSIQERLNFWKASFELFKEKPLFGHGPYSFKFVYPKYQQNLLAISDHPHNLFLKILVENGIFAFLSFTLFLSFIFIPQIYYWIKEKFKNADELQLVAFIALSGFIAHQLIDYNLNFVSNIILFWVLLGWLAQGRENKFKNYFLSLFLLLISLFLIIWSIHDAYFGFYYQKAKIFNETENTENILKNYQKAENIWLKRDFYLDYINFLLPNANKNDFEKIKNLLGKTLKQNKQDARIYNFYGKFYQIKTFSDPKKSKQYFEKAISLDPKNNLEYYFNLLKVLDQQEFMERQKEFENLLKDYLEQLKLNAHNTILTENPNYAILISEQILINLGLDFFTCKKEASNFCEIRMNLIRVKEMEEGKITLLHGHP
ncbi:hypothetical protein A2335_00320 [Candidatus Peregrinibacteria bacterium RIFOXYB2_FULL_32_7]|nr:MAG: hypothetical protein A2335_00320 [Candidatus Peregrinibacteria bacterium RIFOXYB2_FULL_32_7]